MMYLWFNPAQGKDSEVSKKILGLSKLFLLFDKLKNGILWTIKYKWFNVKIPEN